MLRNYNNQSFSKLMAESMKSPKTQAGSLLEGMGDDPMHCDVMHALDMLAKGECSEEECMNYIAMALKKHDPSMSQIDGMMHKMGAKMGDMDKDGKAEGSKEGMKDEALSMRTKKNLKRLAVASAAGGAVALGVHHGLANHIINHPVAQELVARGQELMDKAKSVLPGHKADQAMNFYKQGGI